MVAAGCHFQERHGWERPGYFLKGENPEVLIFPFLHCSMLYTLCAKIKIHCTMWWSIELSC